MPKVLLPVLVFTFLFSVTVEAKESKEELRLEAKRKRIEAEIKKSGLPKSSLGLIVTFHGDEGERDIYRLNSKKSFIPASLTKVVTASAALETLGHGHKFRTRLVSNAPIEKGVLKGDLYLVGGGDPSFVSESMWVLVNHFIRTGIQRIEGDVIVDDHRFDQVRFDPGRQPDRVSRAYDAPIGAMSFNWNSVNVYVRPGEAQGQPAKVYIDPDNEYIQLAAEATTSGKGSAKEIHVSRNKGPSRETASAKKLPMGDGIRVSGHIPLNHEEIVFYKSITQPDYWSGYNLVSFLNRRGVTVSGQVKTGRQPKQAQVLAEYESKPIRQVVADLMKFSNNYVAEMLTKNMAAEKKGTPAQMEDGMDIIREYLQSLGIKKTDFSLTNPSGLSRRNTMRTEDLHKVLLTTKNKFDYFAEYLSSLPVAGIDGTLKRRMKGSSAEGWVRAKTGLLSGVSGLAGYAGDPKGGTMTFVFLYNGKNAKNWHARALFDRMAVALME